MQPREVSSIITLGRLDFYSKSHNYFAYKVKLAKPKQSNCIYSEVTKSKLTSENIQGFLNKIKVNCRLRSLILTYT